MITATGRTADGRPLLLLGLSGENVTRLAAGEPISLDLAALGVGPGQVVLMYGRTEQDIVASLEAHGLPVAEIPPSLRPPAPATPAAPGPAGGRHDRP